MKTIKFPMKCPSNRKNFTPSQWSNYAQWVEEVLDTVFDEADKQDVSNEALAARANLCRQTVERWGNENQN